MLPSTYVTGFTGSNLHRAWHTPFWLTILCKSLQCSNSAGSVPAQSYPLCFSKVWSITRPLCNSRGVEQLSPFTPHPSKYPLLQARLQSSLHSHAPQGQSTSIAVLQKAQRVVPHTTLEAAAAIGQSLLRTDPPHLRYTSRTDAHLPNPGFQGI